MRGKAEIRKLLADVQLCDECTIALDVLLGEVVEMATWTSGEPVSFSCVALAVMTSVFFSFVIMVMISFL